MQKRVQLPNGRIIEVPADITPQEELALVTQLDRESQFDEVAGGVRRAVMGDRDNRAASIPDVLAQAASMTPPGRVLGMASRAPRIVSNLVSRFPRLANAAVQAGAATTAGGAGSVVRSGMDDTPESAGDVVNNALFEMGKQGGAQLLGPAIQSGRGVARGLMRRGLGVSKSAAKKYVTPDGKDLIDEALDRRVLVTKGGLGFEKVQGMRESAQNTQVGLIDNLDKRGVMVMRDPIVNEATEATMPKAAGLMGVDVRNSMAPTEVIEHFGWTPRHPNNAPGIAAGAMKLTKTQLDELTDAAYAAKRSGTPIDRESAERMELAKGINKSFDTLIGPQYRQMNQEIRQTMGLENALRDRLAQPATGMADDITAGVLGAGGNPATALGLRALRGPAALSALANLINQLAKGGKVAPTAARALLMTSRDK